MVHNTRRRRKNNVAELTRREQLDDPFLKIGYADIVAWGDDAGFVNADDGQGLAMIQFPA